MHISTNNPGHHACPRPRAHPQGRVLPAKQKSPPALHCLRVCLSRSELHTLREGPGGGPGGVGGQQPGPPAPQPCTLRTPPPWTQADSSPQCGLFRRHLPLKREGFVFWMWELHLKCISPLRAPPVTVLHSHHLDPPGRHGCSPHQTTPCVRRLSWAAFSPPSPPRSGASPNTETEGLLSAGGMGGTPHRGWRALRFVAEVGATACHF